LIDIVERDIIGLFMSYPSSLLADCRRQAVLLVDGQKMLRGVVTREDLLQAMQSGRAEEKVASLATRDMVVTYPEELLREALKKMLESNHSRLPVVDHAEHWKVVGYLGRAEVLLAQLKRYEEDVREPGYPEIRTLKKLIPNRN
jgi:predicted transcriptional regulator